MVRVAMLACLNAILCACADVADRQTDQVPGTGVSASEPALPSLTLVSDPLEIRNCLALLPAGPERRDAGDSDQATGWTPNADLELGAYCSRHKIDLAGLDDARRTALRFLVLEDARARQSERKVYRELLDCAFQAAAARGDFVSLDPGRIREALRDPALAKFVAEVRDEAAPDLVGDFVKARTRLLRLHFGDAGFLTANLGRYLVHLRRGAPREELFAARDAAYARRSGFENAVRALLQP